MHLLPRSVSLSLTADAPSGAAPYKSWPVDKDYWLGHCEGFRVDGPGGRLGVVEHVVYESRVDRPDMLAVSSGMWRLHTDEVSVQDVVEVYPGEQRLTVRPGPNPVAGSMMRAHAHRALRALGRSESGTRS
jgi:hypothetical protein